MTMRIVSDPDLRAATAELTLCLHRWKVSTCAASLH